MISLFPDLAAMPIVKAVFIRSGAYIKDGHMAVEDGVLYVHPNAWEKFNALVAQLPVKR